MDNIKSRLIYILSISKCNHKKEIMKLDDIKEAHIYCKINQLSGQISGPLIENFIKEKYNMKKNKASMCIGDVEHNENNYEIKVSTGGKDNNKFNYVQLRMNHICEYLLTAYYLSDVNLENFGELFIFKLKKKDMIYLIKNYGGYAHGTIHKLGAITYDDLENNNNDKEYAIRPKYDDECWKYLLNYRIDISSI